MGKLSGHLVPHLRGSLYLKCTNNVVVRHELNTTAEFHNVTNEAVVPGKADYSVELDWALKTFLTDT